MNAGLATRLVCAIVQAAGSHALTSDGAASRFRARSRTPLPDRMVIVRSVTNNYVTFTSVWPYIHSGHKELTSDVMDALNAFVSARNAKLETKAFFFHPGEVGIEWPED